MGSWTAIADGERFRFDGLPRLFAAASPRRSGDELAGIAAGSDAERVAARFALADLPLRAFLSEAVVPYEAGEVTRLILGTHDGAAFAPVSPCIARAILRLTSSKRSAASCTIWRWLSTAACVPPASDRPGPARAGRPGAFADRPPSAGRLRPVRMAMDGGGSRSRATEKRPCRPQADAGMVGCPDRTALEEGA
jgi:hypothetical protein